jgi:hypothetical protein
MWTEIGDEKDKIASRLEIKGPRKMGRGSGKAWSFSRVSQAERRSEAHLFCKS